MPTKAVTPRFAERLCSLAESQLQAQAARSASLDAGALGVISACTAIAALVLTVKSADHLWIATLAVLGVSAGLAIRALRLPGAEEIGPPVRELLDARRTRDDEEIEQSLIENLADETLVNNQSLAHKDPLFARALALLVLAILLELAGIQ
jgi:hypothetical protein